MLVVKLGGGSSIDPAALLDELSTLEEPWILVHGGNALLDDVSTKLGHPPRFVTSPSGHMSRYTDEDTLAAMQMVYRGRINNELVRQLQVRGCNAVGLSGVDGAVLRAVRKETIRIVDEGRKMMLRGDHTGKVHTVDTHLLTTLLDAGFHPVLTPPALADSGEAVNVDGDRASAAVAAAMGASRLVILSDVPGLLRDVEDPASLIEHIPRDALESNESYAKGRFRKKLMGVREALDGGVQQVILATAHGDTPLADALAGQGTVIG